jgi:hypothetical protein
MMWRATSARHYLEVSAGTLSPPFHPHITQYTLRLRPSDAPLPAPSDPTDPKDAAETPKSRRQNAHGPAAVVRMLPTPCNPAADVTVGPIKPNLSNPR